MNGYPVADWTMSKTLPRQKQNVMIIMKPIVPLMPAAHMIALGRTREASLISSDMCTAESAPMRVYTGESKPTINASPLLFQPPRLRNSVKTSWAGFRGAKIQSGIRTAKNPTI